MLGAAWKKSPDDFEPRPPKCGSSETMARASQSNTPVYWFHNPSGPCAPAQRWFSTASPRLLIPQACSAATHAWRSPPSSRTSRSRLYRSCGMYPLLRHGIRGGGARTVVKPSSASAARAPSPCGTTRSFFRALSQLKPWMSSSRPFPVAGLHAVVRRASRRRLRRHERLRDARFQFRRAAAEPSGAADLVCCVCVCVCGGLRSRRSSSTGAPPAF